MLVQMGQFGTDGILAGADSGRSAAALIIAKLTYVPKQPEILVLNFAGVQIATASFLRECLLSVRTFARAASSNWYPVAGNLNDDVLDDLLLILRARSDVFPVCTTKPNGDVEEVSFVGELDQKQEITLDLLRVLGEADAATMRENSAPNDRVGQTAWHNRLNSLSAMGLAVESTIGNRKIYRPLSLEEFNGG